MEELIKSQEYEIASQKFVTKALQEAFLTVSCPHKSTLVSKREFVPASQIKTIGKIEEDEKLIEPIGRQGREVK